MRGSRGATTPRRVSSTGPPPRPSRGPSCSGAPKARRSTPNSTLALDPETGEIRWYFQHIPAETHDLDEVFEIVLVDRGDGLSLFKMGKIGVL